MLREMQSKFRRLREGMTYEQALSLMEYHSTAAFATGASCTCFWRGQDGAIILTFDNDNRLRFKEFQPSHPLCLDLVRRTYGDLVFWLLPPANEPPGITE